MHEGGMPYQLTAKQLYTKYSVTEQGLSDQEAKQRLGHFGLNRLTPKQKLSPWRIYLSQFNNSLTIILLVAASLIFFIWYFGERTQEDLVEGILVIAIVFLITILGFIQEWKAEKAVEALKQLLAFNAKVLRGGRERQVDVSTLVPGDIVILEEGMKVPADIRLLEVSSLTVTEASLTGESVPANKRVEAMPNELQIADQVNMVFAGTVIAQGRAKGMVVETGDRTEIGKIAHFVAEAEEETTPIQQRLDRIGKMLGYIVLAIALLVFLFVMFYADDFRSFSLFQRIIHSFIAAVALAVAAIPEGLPAVVTISLALGTQRMLKRNALIRKLNSIETLGSTDIICADKTGTLTKGEMTVRRVYFDERCYSVTGTGYQTTGEVLFENKPINIEVLSPLLACGVQCNNADISNAKQIIGDPTEAALLVIAAKGNVSASGKRIHEIPFSSERKMMSVIIEDKSRRVMYTKGAPEILLNHCHKIIYGGKEVLLTKAHKDRILAETERMSQEALRTLGFAYKTVTRVTDNEGELVFIGLQGMIDPPRVEVKDLITQCSQAGIRVIMITGDHQATAAAVAQEIGIMGKVVSGSELDNIGVSSFNSIVKEVNVYARVNPTFKMRIVEALKKQGHIVAMTGDGVNDAPALTKADIGVAMGITGTDVAKEASDMVLLDDRFHTIVSAIEEGRGVFDNIRKFVTYLLSSNIAEVLIVAAAIFLFREVPLSATMLLWINVVTDGLPAVALSMDPAEKKILTYSPKKYQGEIVTRIMWAEMLLYGLLLTIGVIALYAQALPNGVEKARSVAFTAVVICELARLFQIRAYFGTKLLTNPWLYGAVGLSFVLQLLILSVPFFARMFGLVPLTPYDWVAISVLACTLGVVMRGITSLPGLRKHFHARLLVAR